MTKWTYTLVGALIFVMAGTATGIFVFKNKTPVVKLLPPVSGSLPDAALKGLDGREIKLSDFRGKPFILNLWASWCPLCIDGLRQLVSVQKEFSGKILFIAINRGESAEQVQKIIQELSIGTSSTMLLDNDDTLYQTLGGFAMPEMLFIDKDGVIKDHQRGPSTLEELRRHAQNLIQH